MPKKQKCKTLSADNLRHAEYYGMQEIFDDLYARSQNGEIFENNEFQILFEQLAVYFAFRHLTIESDFKSGIRFVLMSCWIVGALCQKAEGDMEKINDLVRMYSSEIEYSEENLEILIN